jgi:tRNA threonylcarbamoyl adenosine modification protein YeaZ
VKLSELLSEAHLEISDVNRGAVCVGPGGFTSVRLGVSTANALMFSLKIPFAGVSVFDLMKRQYDSRKDFYMLVEANPSEVIVGRSGSETGSPTLMDITDVIFDSSPVVVARCSDVVKENLNQKFTDVTWIDFESVADLPWDTLEFSDTLIEPWYYKMPNIT